MGRLQQTHPVTQVCAEPIRSSGDYRDVEASAGHTQEQPIRDPQVPDLGDHSGHQGADGECADAHQDDLSCPVAVGAVAAEGGGHGVGQRDCRRVPTPGFFQRHDEHAEGLPD